MEIRHFRYFLCVARHGHFTRAAEQLGIAPPTLSRQIQDMERELGVRLFERNQREVNLTAAGQALLIEAEHAVRQFDGVDRWPSIDIVRRLLNDPGRLPKAGGFGVPVDRWLRGPFREWAETLLSERNLRETGFYDVTMVRREWRHHLSGKHDRRYVLWPILMTLNWIAWRAGRSL